MTNRLQWDVLVSAQIPVVTNDLPPGASEMKWSPISSTLISGERDAVLVDTAITVDQNQPGVEEAAVGDSTALSLRHSHISPLPLLREGLETKANQAPMINGSIVSPEYFHLFGNAAVARASAFGKKRLQVWSRRTVSC